MTDNDNRGERLGACADCRRFRASSAPAHPGAQRGYLRLYLDHVLQADRGADFDFLAASPSGRTVPR